MLLGHAFIATVQVLNIIIKYTFLFKNTHSILELEEDSTWDRIVVFTKKAWLNFLLPFVWKHHGTMLLGHKFMTIDYHYPNHVFIKKHIYYQNQKTILRLFVYVCTLSLIINWAVSVYFHLYEYIQKVWLLAIDNVICCNYSFFTNIYLLLN